MKPKFEKNLAPTDRSFVCYYREHKRFPFAWHYHEEYELTLIVRGHGARFVGDHIDRHGDLDLVLLGPNVPHTWSIESEEGLCAAVVVQFRGDFLGADLWDKPEFKHLTALLDESRYGLCFRGARLPDVAARMRSLVDLDGMQQVFGLLEALDMLGERLHAERLSTKAFTGQDNDKIRRRIEAVLNFITANYDQPIRLEEGAEVAHMPPASFSRFFKQTTGKTFVQYVNELRISRACELLVDTDMSIVDICFASGFQSLANFNRRFHRIRSMSPRAYRKMFGI